MFYSTYFLFTFQETAETTKHCIHKVMIWLIITDILAIAIKYLFLGAKFEM